MGEVSLTAELTVCVSLLLFAVCFAILRSNLTFKALSAIQRGDIEGAKLLYQQCIEKKPDSYIGHLGLAYCYVQLADPEQAILECGSALDCSNPSPQIYCARAAALFDCHRYEESKADCDKLISINCRKDLAYINRSLANFGMKKLDDALADCNEALTLSRGGDIAKCLTNRSIVLAYGGNLEEAIKDCTKAIKIDPKSVLARIFRGYYYAIKRQFDHAHADLDLTRSLPCPPRETAYLLCARAELELLEGDLESALSFANQALDIKPNWPRSLVALALVLIHKGDADTALAELDQAISRDPFHAEAYWARCKAYEVLSCGEKADQDKQAYERLGYRPHM
jgi:tetratricopeptide (TPR) repeat protein